MDETRIDIIDYVVASIYIGAGLFIWLAYDYSILSQEQINLMLSAITFGGPLSLYLMYYKRFRIKSVTLIWLAFGVVQLISVYLLKDNPDFKAVNGTYAENNLNLLIMVIMVSILRVISLVITSQEFVVAAWFSPKDNRKPNVLDYILSFTGFIVLTFGMNVL